MPSSLEEEFLALLAVSPRVQSAIRALMLVPKPQTGGNAARDADIIQRVNSGEPRRTLAFEYNISLDRVNQIMRGNALRGNTVTPSRAKPSANKPPTKTLSEREKELLKEWGADTSDEVATLTAANPRLAAEVYQDIYENADLHATAQRFGLSLTMAEKLYFAEETRRENAMKKEK